MTEAKVGATFRVNDNYPYRYPTPESNLTVTDVGVERVFAFTPNGEKWWFNLDEIDWWPKR